MTPKGLQSAKVSHEAMRESPPFAARAGDPVGRPGNARWFVPLLLVIVLGVGIGYFWWRSNAVAKSAESAGRGGSRDVPVVAVPARSGDLPIYLNGLGTITPFNLVTIRSRVGGQINKIAFKEGQNVKEGDLLIEIDPRPFQVMLEEAEGQLGRDMALLNNAKADLQRYQSAGTSVAQQQIDTAAALVRQYEAVAKSDQAGISSAKLQLSYSRITAPISGRVGLRRVDEGNVIQANDATGLAVITQLQPIALTFNISQDDAAVVLRKVAQGGKLSVDAFDRSFTKKLATGVVSAIDNQIDSATGTLRIKASFENKDESLFPNQFVNARLLVETLKDVTLVPAAAVQRGPDNEFVYVVKADQTVEVRPVTLGPSTDDLTAIEAGLKPGEIVVTDGVDKLQPGAKVAVREGGRKSASTKPATQARSSV